jgi:hypothetical protein
LALDAEHSGGRDRARGALTFPRLTRLDLLDPAFKNDASYAALDPLLAALTHLVIERPGKPMSVSQLKSFVAQIRKSRSLRTLRFFDGQSSVRGADAGDAWSKVAEGVLEDLELDVDLGTAGVERLLRGLRGSKLRRLGFGWAARLDDDALNHVVSAKLPLEALSLVGAELDDDNQALRAVLEKLGSLRELTAKEIAKEGPGAKALADGIRTNTSLERLDLPDTRVEGAAALALAKAIGKHRTLRTIGIDLCSKDKTLQKQIIAALAPTVKTLLPTRFTVSSWLVIGLLREGALTSIDLTGFSQELEKNLPAVYTAAASCKSLEHFAAASQQHNAAARGALVDLIERSPSLRHLDVRFVGLNDRDLGRVLKAAAKSPRLETLGVAEADPSAAFGAALAAFVASRPKLRWIWSAQLLHHRRSTTPRARSVRLGSSHRRVALLSRACRSEPQVADAAAVAREVLEGVEAIKVIDGQMRNRSGFGEAQVDGDAPSAVVVEAKATPADDTSAPGAEVDLERRIRPVARVDGRRPRNLDSLAFVVVDPQHPIPSTQRAIAGSRRFGHAVEGPPDSLAVAGSCEHCSSVVIVATRARINRSLNLQPGLPHGTRRAM